MRGRAPSRSQCFLASKGDCGISGAWCCRPLESSDDEARTCDEMSGPKAKLTKLSIVYKMSVYPRLCLKEVDMIAKAKKVSKTDNPHIEAAERFRQLALILAGDPAEAKAFRVKTGVYNVKGHLKAAYR